MKKLLFILLTMAAIGACNSPQKMTSPTGDSMMNSADSNRVMQGDSTMQRDTTIRKDSM